LVKLNDFYKEIRLEINSWKERKFALIFYFISPIILSGLFYLIAKIKVDWGVYKSLDITSYDLFAPGVFPLILLFIAIQITLLRIVAERSPYGSLDRELLAISKTGLFFGKIIANFFFVFLQCSLMYLAIVYFFPARNYGSDYIIFGFFILTGLFGLILGLFISIFSKTKEQAIELVPIILIGMLIFSGIVVRVENMNPLMANIAKNTPLNLLFDGLQRTMLNGVGFEDMIVNFYKLIIWIISLLFIGWLKFILEIKR
jgi:ABC-type multidrug transport system permease subunit